jgi:hypothetical protein
MTKEMQEAEDSKAGNSTTPALVSKQLNSETCPGGFNIWMRDWLFSALSESVPEGMAKLRDRIKAGDIAILKFAIEQLLRLESELDDPVLVMKSFAELLLKELERLPAETGDEAKTGAEAPAGK